MKVVTNWFRERLPIDLNKLKELSNEPVPQHLKRWWFCLGGTPAYLFVVQIFTGILLAFYYESASSRAYESVRYITEEVAFGWYIRSIHKWAATLMIASIVLHQMRVYFTAAYRKPRELNWMIGMLILICTLMTGFTGYSLVYEQLSYWGATVGANITDSVPLVGRMMKQMMLAGDTYNERTLPRFFILHTAVLPVTLILLLVIHLGLMRLQGVTEFSFEDQKDEEKKTFDFFPDHFYTEIIIGLTLMLILSALATVLPATMGPRANPLETPEVIKPEWWFYVAFRWLKLFSRSFAILSMGFIVFLMFIWPLIDAFVVRKTKRADFHVYLGIVAVLCIIGLTVWEALASH